MQHEALETDIDYNMDSQQLGCAILVTLFGTLIIAADSLWLVTPHNVTAKLKDGYMMRQCYGGLCRMKHMDTFDGWFAILTVVPGVICSWIHAPWASVVVVCSLAIVHPFMVYVGFCMALGGLLPGLGPLLFVFMSSAFGGALVWRVCAPATFLLEAKYASIAEVFHVLFMVIMLSYARVAYRTCPALKYTIKLAQSKETAVVDDKLTWRRGEDSPVGFVADLVVAERAAKEQAELPWVPYWRTFAGLVVVLGGLGGALAAVSLINEPISTFDLRYLTLGLVASSVLALLYFVIACHKGGFGRDALKVAPAPE